MHCSEIFKIWNFAEFLKTTNYVSEKDNFSIRIISDFKSEKEKNIENYA